MSETIEYIERESLKKSIREKANPDGCMHIIPHDVYSTVLSVVECEPAADVAEVKRGKWIYKRGNYMTGGGNPLWCCSVCGKVVGASLVPPKYSYCPNCGAKMD